MDIRTKRLFNLPKTILSLISQIDQLKGQWIGGAKLNTQALGRLKRSVLVTSTGASTRIEGSRLSDEDVEKFMRGLALQKFTECDKQEVLGYFELLENVFRSWKHIPLSEGVIKQLHRDLLQHTNKDERHRGEYKKMENSVEMFDESGKSIGVIFETTPAYLVPPRMAELIAWTKEAFKQGQDHPLIIISNFVVEFLAIHPFQDGNGRLSRVLTNLLLLRSGYEYVPYISHEKLIEDNKAEYYVALHKSQASLGTKQENIIPWLDFFLKISLEQASRAIELLSHENIEKILSPKQLVVWRYLETIDETSAGQIAKATGVARPTVSQAIEVLLRLKKLERIGQGRTTRYRKV